MPSNRDHILTIFAPGLGGSLGQAAKYTKTGGEFLHNIWTGESAFTDNAQPYDVWMARLGPSVVALLIFFLHGHRYPEWKALRILLCIALIPFALASTVSIIGLFRGNVSSPYLPLPWRVNIGQKADVDHYLDIVSRAALAHPDKSLVLFGTSRGGAVVTQAWARLANHPGLASRVKLVVAECPFDSVDAVMQTREFFLYPWSNSIIHKWLPRLTAYNPLAPSPIDILRAVQVVIPRIPPPKIPIAFIASNADVVVKKNHTLALVSAATDWGGRVHILVLDRSSHSGYPVDDEADREEYKRFLDHLYDTYVPVEVV